MNESMINNMTADELRQHIERADDTGEPISARVGLRLAELDQYEREAAALDENAGGPIDALERVYDSLESAVRELVRRDVDAAEAWEYGEGLGEHDVSTPDQLAYQHDTARENLARLTGLDLTDAEAEALTNDMCRGRVSYELRPDYSQDAIIHMDGSGECQHPLGVDLEQHLDALLNAADMLDYWQENPTSQVRDSVFDTLGLSMDGGQYGVMVDAPDRIAVVPNLEQLEQRIAKDRGVPGNYCIKRDGIVQEWTVIRDNELGEIVGQDSTWTGAVLQAWADLEAWQRRHGEQ